MKRLCSEMERQILCNNKNMIYKGMYETDVKGSNATMFIGLAVSFIFMLAGIVPMVILSEELNLEEYSKAIFGIWVLFSLSVPNVITRIIIHKIKVKRQISKFVNKSTIAINGATIVGVSADCNMVAYIEDGYVDEKGNPIIIDYPITSSELYTMSAGMRMIVMYESDTSFQLMRVNEQLRGMIPMYDEKYPLQNDPASYKRVPHPNAYNISATPRMLDEVERQKIAEAFVTKNQEAPKKAIKVCSVCFFIAIMVLAVILSNVEGVDVGIGLLIGVAVWGGLMLLFILASMIGKVRFRNMATFYCVQEVIFHSNIIENIGRSVNCQANVFEWMNGTCNIVSYPMVNIPKPIKYGDVVYKLTSTNGKTHFLKKEDVR